MMEQSDIFKAVLQYLQNQQQKGIESVYLSTESMEILQKMMQGPAVEEVSEVEETPANTGQVEHMATDLSGNVGDQTTQAPVAAPQVQESGSTYRGEEDRPENTEVSKPGESITERFEKESSTNVKPAETKIAAVGDAALVKVSTVKGWGSEKPSVMFVGQEPCFDVMQEPFQQHRETMTKMIGAMGMGMNEVYFMSVMQGQVMDEEAVSRCFNTLKNTIDERKPGLVVIMGALPLKWLVGDEQIIAKLRGKWLKYGDVYCMPTFHPAAYGVTSRKREAWQDLQKVMKALDKLKAMKKESE